MVKKIGKSWHRNYTCQIIPQIEFSELLNNVGSIGTAT